MTSERAAREKPGGASAGSAPRRPLLMGVGNDFRRDDALGLRVARRVGESASDLDIVEVLDDMGSMIDHWRDRDLVIVVDATKSEAPPGSVTRFDLSDGDSLPAVFRRHVSSHGLGVVEAVDLARAVGQMPRRLIVYGIEGKDFSIGESANTRGIDDVTRMILEDLSTSGAG